MIDQQLGLQLHDRATRGLVLSKVESVQLEQWYAEQDALEIQELGLEQVASPTTSIQTQIEATLRQIAALTQQIQQMILENQQLKKQNEQLSVQVARLYGSQAA